MQSKNRVFALVVVISVGLLGLSAQRAEAGPITYSIDRTLDQLSDSNAFCSGNGYPGAPDCVVLRLVGTVTTDGTLGGWGGVDHFTNIQLEMSDGTSSVAMDTVFPVGESMTATADHLLISFGSVVTFRSSAVVGVTWTFCATQRTACTENAQFAPAGVGIESFMSGEISGVTASFADALPVPEPSTALLAGLGLGIMSAARCRKHQIISESDCRARSR